MDNHQYEFAVELNKLELALIADDEKDLVDKILSYNILIKSLKIKNNSTKINLINYLLEIVRTI